MNNLIKAVLSVMEDVKGIDKTMNVGTGSSSYKGVSDKEVKKIIGSSMKKHGLVLFPTEINPKTTIERWEEVGQYGAKMKQSVFTEVTTKYLLCHESGECIELSGYGNGVDNQDKSAGKATTYALKYALLYTFLVPTGTIDDADNTHSDEAAVPRKTTKALPELTEESYQKMVEAIKGGQKSIVVSAMSKYKIPQNYLDELNKLLA